MTLLLRVLHIGTAAAWFGHKLLVPGDIRTALESSASANGLLERLERAERLGQLTGLGTLFTGALLWWNVGSVSGWVMVGAGLVVVAILIGATVARPASIRLREAVEANDYDVARASGRRIMTVLGIESVIWVAALITMVI